MMPTAHRSRRRAESDPSVPVPRSLWPFSMQRSPESAPQLVQSPTTPCEPTKRNGERRVPDFHYVNGSKLPLCDMPWPFAFNREYIDLNGIDHALVAGVKGNQMFYDVDLHNGWTPTRCLDLGTTLGDWVIDSAHHLPQCTFVGFDIVDIQIPLKYIEPSIARRIEWRHGDFLQFPLPFEDEEFDYVHVESIAHGVRECDWDGLFQELHRIMKPGGRIELVQGDARFPVLPHWFTAPLHTHFLKFADEREDTSALEFLLSDENRAQSHAYVSLEKLFFMVLQRRWINPNPTSILPLYFNATFRQVVSPPVLHFPMPPLAPLPPFPKWALNPIATSETTSDPSDPTLYFVPISEPSEFSDSGSTDTTATGISDGSEASLVTPPSSPLGVSSRSPSKWDTDAHLPPTPASPVLIQKASVIASEDDAARSRSNSNSSVRSTTSAASSSASGTSSQGSRTRARSSAILQTESTTRLGGDETASLFRMEVISQMGPEALFMHLRHASVLVLAMREAMWDVLRECAVGRRPELAELGFVRSERELQGAPGRLDSFRALFDGLMDRYKQDMHIRLSPWHSLVKSGFAYPRWQKMSEEELAREEDLRRALLEVRRNAKEEDFAVPSRSVRLLLGVKGV